MFQSLREKPRILVTGPMRSGTTICAEMIARDIGREVLREEIATKWPIGDWPADKVVQVPYVATQMWHLDGTWFAILMQRSIDETYKSSEKYFKELFPSQPLDEDAIRAHLAWMQRACDHYAKLYPKQTLKVNYDELRSHELWVEDRSKFAARQTRL